MTWKGKELSTNAWHKTVSDVSMKMTADSGGLPEAFKMVEQQPNASTRTLLAEFAPSQSNINRHLHKFGLDNKRCRDVLHESANEQRLNDLGTFANNCWQIVNEPIFVKQGRFEQKLMLCLVEFQRGIYFELVPDGHAVSADIYAASIYDTLKVCY